MSAGTKINLTIKYFALLREERGLECEVIETTARTPASLWDNLKVLHGFALTPSMLMVAVNGEFGAWDTQLKNSDEVVFLPPVAGG